ncbi:MAG: glycosyltransferase family 2 protein [Candidatus Omnitrophica bacterium]|nr:glycosyltransferase family 2 protein [Candidatus Omnitrophota bacterium]
MKPKIIAIIPALNEEKTIAKVIQGVKPHVDEIIVVDDGSKDQTAINAKEQGAVLVSHPRILGYDRSIADGFALANERNADIVFTFDADGQHHPEDIPRLVDPILRELADVVVGKRPRYARVTEHLYALVAKAKANIDDPLCGFKVYRMDVYRDVGYFDRISSIGTQLVFNAKKKGYRVVQESVTVHERADHSRFGKRIKSNWKIFMAMGRTILLGGSQG